MSNNCLIILTKEFPFSSGEPFLESELPLHLDNFDKIIILSQELDKDAKQTRIVDNTVKFHNIAVRRNLLSRAFDLGNGLWSMFFSRKVVGLDQDVVKNSILKRLFLEYFEARAQRQFNEILKMLEKYDFSSFEKVTIYSYWFFVGARVAALLKEWFQSHRIGIHVKAFSRAHGYDLYEYRNKLDYLPMREKLLKDLDHVYPCSDNGRRYLTERFPEYKSKIETAKLGTRDYGINPATQNECFHLVSCSRLVPIKRVYRIMESIALLESSGLKLKWTHIGGGKDLEKFRTQAKQIKFADIEFIGAIRNQEVYQYYLNHPVHLFINVSQTEGLPVSIMEASSFGIPTIATDVGGTSEIVAPGVSGELLSKDFKNEELAELIKNFAKMPAPEYSEYRKSARYFWESHFMAQVNYQDFSNNIRNL